MRIMMISLVPKTPNKLVCIILDKLKFKDSNSNLQINAINSKEPVNKLLTAIHTKQKPGVTGLNTLLKSRN